MKKKTVKFGTEIVRDVDIDAVSINTNILKNVPEKFEIAYPGEASISADNQVWIVVKPAQETKLVPVIFLGHFNTKHRFQLMKIKKLALMPMQQVFQLVKSQHFFQRDMY